jgi:hypothetical protein
VDAAGVEGVEGATIVWIRLYEAGALTYVACEISAHLVFASNFVPTAGHQLGHRHYGPS